jgi:hypothetical protein
MSESTLAVLVKVDYIVISSAVVRRVLVERVGGFGEDMRLRGASKTKNYWRRVGAVSRLACIPEPLLAYREHGGSMMAGIPTSP